MQTVVPDTIASADPTRSRQRFLVQMVVFLAVLIVLPIAAVGVSYVVYARRANALDHLPPLGRVPDFSLVERSGEPISRADLKGRVWIADFIFTYCAGPCPRMTATFAKMQNSLRDANRIRLVTFTVDPDRDTPAALREYADRHGADPEKWLFVTGDRPDVHRLVAEGFKLGSIEEPMMHSTRFVLVDAHGAVRGYYDSEEPSAVDSILEDARRLADAD